jgi:hypothetical protein
MPSSELRIPDTTLLPKDALTLSLYLRRVTCLDETEHEGVWPFEGEGVANDAIRLSALVTSQRGERGTPIQGRTPIIDLGSNYQDGTRERFYHRLATFPLIDEQRFPLTVNAAVVLIEEDWGGQMNEVTERVLHDIGDFIKTEVAKATSTAVGAAIGGAIGTALGPLGTTVGAGIGAAVGFIVQQLGAGLDALKSDAFPPQDVSVVLANKNATFSSGGREFAQRVKFEGFGGSYQLDFVWRLANADRKVALRCHNGRYVMALNGGGGVVNATSSQTKPLQWETFVMEDIGSNAIALRAYNGRTLCAEGGGGGALVANRGMVGPWERFSVRVMGGGKVALRSSNGKYLCAENGGGAELLFNRDSVAEWETFKLELV